MFSLLKKILILPANAPLLAANAALKRELREHRATQAALEQANAFLADQANQTLQRFHTTFENAAIGLAHVSPDGGFLLVNQHLCDKLGYSKEELLQLKFPDITHPDDLAEDWAIANEFLNGERETYSVQKRYLHKSGSLIWAALHASLVRKADHVPDYFIAAIETLTEQKEAEFKLQNTIAVLAKRDRQLELVFESAELGDWEWDINRDEVRAHPIVFRQYGRPDTAGPVPFNWFLQRQHPEDRSPVTSLLQLAMNGSSRFHVEFRVIHPDSSTHWLAFRGSIVRDEHGSPLAMHGVSLDVTNRKEAEAAAKEFQKQLLTLAEVVPQMLWITNPDGDIEFFNQPWYRYTGQKPADAAHWGWTTALHPEDVKNCFERWSHSLSTGETYELETRLRAADGSYRWFLNRALPMRDKSGRITRWFGTSTDIHQQKSQRDWLEAEVQLRTEDLRRSLLEKETLLKEIHHRVKNNLQVISSLLRMQSDLLTDHTAVAALKDSQSRVQSMAMIHDRFYSGAQIDVIDFGQYLEKLISEVFRSFGATAQRIIPRLDVSPVPLTLQQAIPCGLIFNELVTNALKYAYPHDRAGEITVALSEDDKGMVTLTVSDHGVGLPPDLNWKSSKSLGLPIVNILANQLGGSLTASSEAGAKFVVTFPRQEASKASFAAA